MPGPIGKLSKLKCIIKRWHSSSRISRSAASSARTASSDELDNWRLSASFHGDKVPAGLHPVYVGKSRRRYLVSSDVVAQPLFQVLVERSGGIEAGGTLAVGCEVVLFEHLLWMLENAEPPPESLDELVDFYAC